MTTDDGAALNVQQRSHQALGSGRRGGGRLAREHIQALEALKGAQQPPRHRSFLLSHRLLHRLKQRLFKRK